MSLETAWRTPEVIAACELIREFDSPDAVPLLAAALRAANYPDGEGLLAKIDQPVPRTSAVRRLVNRVLGGGSAEASVAWLKDFADKQVNLTYRTLMEAAASWVSQRHYTGVGHNEDYKDVTPAQWEEFWAHYEAVTGEHPDSEPHPDDTASWSRPEGNFFSCSC